MWNGLTMIATAALALAAAQAAADTVRQPPMTRHQMNLKTVGCMRKRMAIDQRVSYNEAAKTCKDQITQQNDIPPHGAPRNRLPAALASIDSPRHP